MAKKLKGGCSTIFFSLSHEIVQLPFISCLLEGMVLKWKPHMKPRVILGWGLRPSSDRAKCVAIRLKSLFIYLEDGFMRSYGTGLHYPPLALVVDKKGIYYDSSNQSQLEHTIATDEALLVRDVAISCTRSLIIANNLSKYNHTSTFLPLRDFYPYSDEKILVVDQTAGDMSVLYGGAGADSFLNMLATARAENPTATIYVKTHPEVTSGRKKGYLTHIQDSDRIVMIRDDINPIDLIKKMDKVYVVTSQMGFEALMCGKPVVCFGVPWYAGWGLTDDRVKDSPTWARRTKKRTVDELFAAAYIHYTRYLNPFTHQRGTIFDVIEWLILQKKMASGPFTRNFALSTHKLPANAE